MEVKLNIGGTLFTTTKATVMGSGADSGSLLAIMFDDDQAVGKKMIDGGFFFDRDGTHFAFVLSYLRDGNQQVASIPEEKLAAVKIEAEFFLLAGMNLLKHNCHDAHFVVHVVWVCFQFSDPTFPHLCW
jgi:hypothetical protein